MKVLMVGVDKSTKGGMWTVVENYFNDSNFMKKYNIKYIPTSITGNILKRLLFNFFAIVRTFFYTLFNSYDILHVHMSEKGSVFRKNIIINISKIRNSKIIIHMHGAEFEKWYETLSMKKQKKVRMILNKCDVLIILGNYWTKFMSTLVDDKNKIKVVYNAVDCPGDNQYNSASNQLLFLGAVGKRKGIYDLIEAMKIVKNKSIETKLVIYGPDTTGGIDQLIEDNGLNDIIEYKGWLSNEDKPNILQNVAVNILPSYNEGLPMTILETMGYGIPNISTNVAAIPEVLNNDNGKLIEPGNPEKIAECIEELMNDKLLRIKKSEESYELIKKDFSVGKHIKIIGSIYEELSKK